MRRGRRILAILLVSVMLTLTLCACTDTDKEHDGTHTENGPQSDVAPSVSEDAILLFDGEKYTAVLIRAGSLSDIALQYFDNLRSTLTEAVSAQTDISAFTDEHVEDGTFEILVGDTNRVLSQEVLSALVQQDSFVIDVSERGVVIAGATPIDTEDAIEYFLDVYLPQNLIRTGERAYLKMGRRTESAKG